MANSRKYVGLLPDLDSEQDIYETPELTDDASTHPPQSETPPIETEDEELSGVSRSRLDPYSARSALSGRIERKKKSYRVSSRGRNLDEGDDLEASSDEDASGTEGLKRKIARLQREAEELKAEIERQDDREKQGEDSLDQASLDQLGNAIKTLNTLNPYGGPHSAEARLALRIGEAVKGATKPGNASSSAIPDTTEQSTYTISYHPLSKESSVASVAASFDTRLAALESALGISSIPLPVQSTGAPKPILPTLDILERQMAMLESMTPASLETISKRVHQLTEDAEKLDEKRKAAKQSYDEMRSAASEPYPDKRAPTPAAIEDAEMESKISALYSTLPKIEAIAPILPSVLERLRSLRLLHVDAAGAAERLGEVEKKSSDMEEEVKRWTEGLRKVESAVNASEETAKRNFSVIEDWVKDLETRIKQLDDET